MKIYGRILREDRRGWWFAPAVTLDACSGTYSPVFVSRSEAAQGPYRAPWDTLEVPRNRATSGVPAPTV